MYFDYTGQESVSILIHSPKWHQVLLTFAAHLFINFYRFYIGKSFFVVFSCFRQAEKKIPSDTFSVGLRYGKISWI